MARELFNFPDSVDNGHAYEHTYSPHELSRFTPNMTPADAEEKAALQVGLLAFLGPSLRPLRAGALKLVRGRPFGYGGSVHRHHPRKRHRRRPRRAAGVQPRRVQRPVW
jgi:hypothetical protein